MKKINDTKVYILFVCALCVVAIIVANAHTILPVMDDDEFFVDENKMIHNKHCPYKSVPWFAEKKSKYDFIKLADWDFCDECFSKNEISKLMTLHHCNVELYIERLHRNGATEEYIDNRLKEMKLER